ncbi:hypothetical protein FRD01_19200 [Microvenator marinus]|uniref:Uncharacterized protein n=1 Tax=Microvenator marinus TaxID=2600177 RepID=A0A5B8XVX2_9DELT|nr:hypothetical protein [Microvenator marinus]QED29321.1 hypothetical protein FRD01_19200 [Microvenator marinus]
MSLSIRSTDPRDLVEMVKLVPPFVFAEVDRTSVVELWRRWLDEEIASSRVITRRDAGGEFLEGFGMTVFLKHDFVESYLEAPQAFLAAQIYERELAGNSVVMSRQEIAAANWDAGLYLFVLHYAQRAAAPESSDFEEVLTVAHTGFRESTEGYDLLALWQEAFLDEEAAFLGSGGMRVCFDFGEFERAGVNLHGRLMGLTRAQALSEPPGSTVSFAFRTPPPEIGFTPGQQRVLEIALRGESDIEIASELSVSRDAIKQMWRAIYERVEKSGAKGLLAEDYTNHRRRRALLEYLRNHPEELRPLKR